MLFTASPEIGQDGFTVALYMELKPRVCNFGVVNATYIGQLLDSYFIYWPRAGRLAGRRSNVSIPVERY